MLRRRCSRGMTAHYLSHDTVSAEEGGDGRWCMPQPAGRAAAGADGAQFRGTSDRYVSREEKAALARAAGAEDVILYTQVDLRRRRSGSTGCKGVDGGV